MTSPARRPSPSRPSSFASVARAALPRLLLALCAAVTLPAAHAQDASSDASVDATEPVDSKEPVPLWEIGLVGIAARQAPYPGADKDIGRVRVLPYGLYRGSFLRVDGGGVGLRALKTPRFEWDASGSAAFGSPSNRVPARHDMPSIGTLVEIGPALKINLGDLVSEHRDPRATRLELPVRAVFDVNDGFARKGWTFEPWLAHTAWTGRTGALVLGGGLLFGDRALNHLYYGVDAPYATSDRPAYEAKAGLVATRVSAGFRQRVAPSVRLVWFASAETVRGAANEASPLVRSRQDFGFGVSAVWGIWHSAEEGTR